MSQTTISLGKSISKFSIPAFSVIPLFLVVAAKPLSDAFYETNAVKYGYMALLIFSAFFAYAGNSISRYSRQQQYSDSTYITNILILVTIYTAYLFGVSLAYGGSPQDVFKIISPFLFFILVAGAPGRWTVQAIALSAFLTITINALLLPTDFGWVYWGTVRTFKGYYYFKTDLAFAICFSILFIAIWLRFKLTYPMVGLLFLATVQIVVANSRLNYLILVVILIFLAVKNGKSLASLLRYGAIAIVLAIVAVFFYDPTKLLGFDFTNERAFTQGRNVIWDVLISEGLGNYSLIEWIFGRGLFADISIFAKNILHGEAHNAHNEWLHLLLTQGIVGCCFYIALWVQVVRASTSSRAKWTAGTGALAIFILIMQSFTSVVSSFATKTWPLAMIFLMLRELRSESRCEEKLT